MMNLQPKISSKALALIAGTVWLSSLPMTGLVIFADQKRLSGFEILWTGWLSPLVVNFAWFANVFFLFGISRLLTGKVPVVASILAAIVALDTFRFSKVMLDEGGGSSPVYGYGWGAVLWFLAIFLMMVATGARQHEINATKTQPYNETEWLRPIGMLLAVITLGLVAYWALGDRRVANSLERQRLTEIAFKRGNVCRAPDPIATEPIHALSGALEIVSTKKDALTGVYPFGQIKNLLAWGIPIVRVGNVDYSYGNDKDNATLFSVPAKGAPAAILQVDQYAGTVTATLVDGATKRTVFEQVWRPEDAAESYYRCPDYNSFPGPEQQPRRLLMQALGLSSAMARPAETERQRGFYERVVGTEVGQAESGLTQAMRTPERNTNGANGKADSKPNYHDRFNIDCPANLGWEPAPIPGLDTGWPFRVDAISYYPAHREYYMATCTENSVFLYLGTARDGKYYLHIEKRTLPDFRQAWASLVEIPYTVASGRDNSMDVVAVRSEPDSVILKLVDRTTARGLMVQVPIREEPIK